MTRERVTRVTLPASEIEKSVTIWPGLPPPTMHER